MTNIADINKSEHDNIDLEGVKIKNIYEVRSVNTRYGTKTVRDIILEDDTGEIRWSEWSPKDYHQVGDVLDIFDAYVKASEYKGETRYQLGTNKDSKIRNRTAKKEDRKAGDYLKAGSNASSSSNGNSGSKSIDKDELKIAIAEGIQPIIDLVNENHAAVMKQIKLLIPKNTSKKEE